MVGVGGTFLSKLLYIGICSPKGLVLNCCGVKLCIDFKLCGLKQGKVFCPLEQGPAIGEKTGNALYKYVTLLRY